MFTITIGGSLGKSRIESKSHPLDYVLSETTLDILVSDFNKMNSFTYNLSHSFPFECYASYNENKDITPKELIKATEDHENQASIIDNTILINLGTPNKSH